MPKKAQPFKILRCHSCQYTKNDKTGKAKAKCQCGAEMYPSENWYSRVMHNGITKVRAHTTRKADAEDFIHMCDMARRTGAIMPGEEVDISWKTAKKNVEKWWEESSLSRATKDFYAYMMLPLTEYFGGSSLLRITKEAVGDYMVKRQREVSITTARHELSALKRIYNMHLERLEMEERPALMKKCIIIGKIKPPKLDNEIDRFCEVTEVSNVFATIEGNKKAKDYDKARTRLGIMLGVGLGMRPINICGLEWKEFDLKAGTIAIPKSKMKNRKKDYITGIPPGILAELTAWRKMQKVISPFVFPSPKDASKPIRNMRTAINRAIREAHLNAEGVERKKKVTPYVLTRHTFASQALMNSGDLTAVSEQLHHSNIQITKRRYAKVNVDYKKQKMDEYETGVLNKMLEGRK